MARAEDGGTITTTEIEFSHQSSRCEESACTHASIRPASRISRVSTGCASGDREGEGEKRAAASEKDRRVRKRERGNPNGSVLPAPFVSATRYIRMGARRLPRKAKPATAALTQYLRHRRRFTCHARQNTQALVKKRPRFPEEISIRVTVILRNRRESTGD